VDVHQRVVVIDVSEDKSALQVFINPEIIEREGEQVCEEGCLSVPGIYEKVARAERVRVRALDVEGKPFELAAEGLLAVCIQHEIDHLDGKVFVEYLSNLKLNRIRTKLAKKARITA
jgi:peptide deformylase